MPLSKRAIHCRWRATVDTVTDTTSEATEHERGADFLALENLQMGKFRRVNNE